MATETTPNTAPPTAPPPSAVRKVIFADFAVVKFNSVINWLKSENIVAEAVTDTAKFLSAISEHPFDVCVVNLVLGGVGPFEMLSNVRKMSRNPDIKIIVTSRQNHRTNIQNSIRAGANDFVTEPFEPENLHNRLLYHLTPKQVIQLQTIEPDPKTLSAESMPYVHLLFQAIELLCATERGQEHAAFFKILSDVAKLIDSNRTSLIIVDAETDSGVVLASSDDEKFIDFPISLNKYPEIQHVMNAGNFVFIEDTSRNQMTQKLNETVRTISIGSLMVFPVRFANDVVGVLNIRRSKATELPALETMRLLQMLANTMAPHSNIKAMLRKIYKSFTPPGGTPSAKAG